MSTVTEKPAGRKPTEGAPDDPKSLETRFGLVMYGGVSLAIYINGVAREFFRAVRGAGVYKLIKALTDSDVVVDVISGTSAGGINGILLGYALCNRKEFASCSALWRLDGDVRSLLRSPHGADGAESLFDGEDYYQPRLEAAFREMPEYVEEEGEINSDFKELDLFVTGTDVDGQISTQFDDAGHPIDVKDHRSLFLLKHRRGRKHPFEPASAVDGPSTPEVTYKALAKLARITSCFPAAFTPVHVSGTEPPGNATMDGKLQLWGQLGKDSSFLDGGVIDNKPFTYTIHEIFGRAADRLVERKLFYVEPDPEHFKRPEVASRPNFVQAVIASLIGIPGYESIADDLRLLAEHNTKVQQYKRLLGHLEERRRGAAAAPDRELYDRCSLVALSERIMEGILKVNGKTELLSRRDRAAAKALIVAFDKVQKQLSEERVRDDSIRQDVPVFVRNFNVYFRLRRLYRMVYMIVEVLGREKRLPEGEIGRLTNLWRLLNREIEMLEIVRTNMERLIDEAPIRWKDAPGESDDEGDDPSPESVAEARVIWDIVTEALLQLTERRGPAAALIREAFKGQKEEIRRYNERPEGRLEGFSQQTLTDFNRRLREKGDAIIDALKEGDKFRDLVSKDPEELKGRSVSFRGILSEARLFEEQFIAEMLPAATVPAKFVASPRFWGVRRTSAQAQERILTLWAHREEIRRAYKNFSEYDAQLFPIEFVADLNGKDVIETVRISPVDAERGFSNKGLSDKVSGDALYHFAGFFKRSWRSNDILWGRLDGLCQLVETLLTPKRIERVLSNEVLLGRARGRFFVEREGNEADREKNKDYAQPGWDWVPAMNPARLFPHAGQTTQDDIGKWLRDLLLGGAALDRKEFARTKLARIVEAGQLEVIYEDLPGVITDALEEQARWNQFRYPSDRLKSGAPAPAGAGGDGGGRFDPTSFPPVYIPAGGSLDAFASVIAAAGAASDAMRHLEQRPAAGTTPMDTGVGQFFSRDYRIGSEALLRDLPPLVLLEIISTALLVVRNCVLKVLGGQAERIRKHPLYVFGIDLPLRAFNTLVLFMRRVPDSRKSLPLFAGVAALFLLAVGVVWFNPIVWAKEDGLHKGYFLIFIFGPVAVLAAWCVYLFQGKVNGRGRLRRAGDALLVLLLVAPLAVVTLVYEHVYGRAVTALQEVYAGWFGGLHGLWPELLASVQGRGWAAWLAQLSVLACFGLTYIFPVLALLLVGRVQLWFRSPRRRLRRLLEKYFSIPEMLVVARRLDLFDEGEAEALASDLGVFDGEDVREIRRRSLAQLKEFRKWLRRNLGMSGTEGAEAYQREAFKEGAGRERRQAAYSVTSERFEETERARQHEALYKRLPEELEGFDRKQRDEFRSSLPRPGAAEGYADEEVDRLIRLACKLREERTHYIYKAVERARNSDQVVKARAILAERIVAAAARDGRRDAHPGAGGEGRKARGKMLERLEEMMYSINPGVMG
ncbi:MAG TPA: patatin-like protein [Pyrinomonadaceae bacterium]|jgi:patatin-related protein